MSDLSISPDLPSLVDHIENAPNTMSSSAIQSLNSASSIEELEDQLTILERCAGNNHALRNDISQINQMIESGNSLSDIQTYFIG